MQRAAPRATWRAVAVPTEHGGWGLTLEPALLVLPVAFSWAGVVAGVAAFIAFLVRTPLKLVLVDRRRQRFLERTRLARRVAFVELATLTAPATTIVALAGWRWLIIVATLGAAIEWSVIVGTIAVGILAIVHVMRRPTIPPAKALGIWQMVLGFAVVAPTAAGVRMIG